MPLKDYRVCNASHMSGGSAAVQIFACRQCTLKMCNGCYLAHEDSNLENHQVVNITSENYEAAAVQQQANMCGSGTK